MQAWEEYDSDILERAWGHLFSCYREIMKHGGSNQYVKPHTGVNKRQKAGDETVDSLVPMDAFLRGTASFDALDNHLVVVV